MPETIEQTFKVELSPEVEAAIRDGVAKVEADLAQKEAARELPRAIESAGWALLADVIEGGGEKQAIVDGWQIQAQSDGAFATVTITNGESTFEQSHKLKCDCAERKARAITNYRSMAKRQ